MLESLLFALILSVVGDCESNGIKGGTCSYSGSLDDTGVSLDGSATTPGTLDIEGGDSDGGASAPPCDSQRFGVCEFWISPPPSAGVTITDVAHFAPDVGGHLMEPNGWSVTGLPTNFFAATSTQTMSGTVLGTPADVRFTPSAWHWDYGDGAHQSSGTGGGSWAALGVREFSSTPTSHIFGAHGEYLVTLTVDFAAEYRVGGGQWVRIPGLLPRAAPPLRVLSRGARTVLVDENCLANPRGPGC